MSDTLNVVIPAFYEGAALAAVLEAVRGWNVSPAINVVDDVPTAAALQWEPMAENQGKSGGRGKAFKLFAIIVVILLVPLVLDQAEVDGEAVRQVGRVAAGLAGLLFLYGIFSKVMKVLAFVVVALITYVVLVSEDQLEAPRLKELFAGAKERQQQPR